jgi:hypothetical protein
MDVRAIETVGRSPDPRTVLAGLPDIIFGAPSRSETVPRIAELVKQTIPGVVDASVTLIRDGVASTIGRARSLASHLDHRQYDAGFGPCLDAALSGETITIDDTAHSVAYPAFGRIAHRYGITRTLSVGLSVERRARGSLNLYGGDEATFDASTAELATAFASYVAVAVADAGDRPRSREEGSWLQRRGCDLRADSLALLESVAAVEDSLAAVMERLALGSDGRGHQADAERRRRLAEEARRGAARARLLSQRGAAR